MTQSISKPVIRLFSNFDYPREHLEKLLPGSTLEQSHYSLKLNESGEADFTVVLGFAQPGMWVKCPPSRVVKLVQDPPQAGLFGRYTRIRPKFAHKMITPFGQDSSHVQTRPTVLDWHIGLNYDDLSRGDFFRGIQANKKRSISMIASNKRYLPGHRSRDDFVTEILSGQISIDVFGRGRPNPLRDKWEGLEQYRYSIAVENLRHDNYWTEKISDVLLAGSCPIYFGSPNIFEFFPVNSLLVLQELKLHSLETISSNCSSQDYASRASAIEEARHRILQKYTMHPFLIELIENGEGNAGKKKLISLVTLDSFAHKARDQIAGYRDGLASRRLRK